MKKVGLKIVFLISIFILLLIGTNNSMATGMNIANNEILNSQSQGVLTISTEEDTDITSKYYLVSELYSYIGRILPKTTTIQFKNNFSVDSDKIHIYKDNTLKKEINSGYVGTNMVVKFDGLEKIYEISVIGDFNGDGLSNQIEVQSLIRHIVFGGENELKGLMALSADVNKDNAVNQIDLNILINYIVFGRLSTGGITRPEKPSIEVVSGEQNDEDIYLTNVTIKITPTETVNVEKTVYTISGTKEVEETLIPENGQITLTEDGIYTINSYTYGKDGQKSDVAKLVIKKITSEMIDEQIGLKIKLDNEEGADYTVGEWTSHDICIMTYPITVKFGDNAEVNVETKYTISGAKNVPIPVKNATLLTATGEYEITAIATDEFGRTRMKTYNVKIDKDVPENSSIAIDGGTKNENGYYNKDLTITVTQGSDSLSGLDKVTYQMTGANSKEETEIEDQGTISITENGTTNLIIKTYDNAGNIALLEEEIKLDKDKPTELTLTPSEITSTSFTLTATAKDAVSGIKQYEFFIDGNSYKTIATSEETATITVTKLKTTKHLTKVIVTDNAGNTEEEELNVANLELQEADISNIVFEITDFTVAEDASNRDTYFDKVVSDTSLSTVSKYIQLSSKLQSEDEKTGEIQGKVKVIRTDGVEIEELEFFPKNLTFTFEYESDGSGTSFSHKTIAEVFGQAINSQDNASTEVTKITKEIKMTELLSEDTKKNNFKITEKKTNGTSSYTRLTISKVKLGEKELEFEIVDTSENK